MELTERFQNAVEHLCLVSEFNDLAQAFLRSLEDFLPAILRGDVYVRTLDGEAYVKQYSSVDDPNYYLPPTSIAWKSLAQNEPVIIATGSINSDPLFTSPQCPHQHKTAVCYPFFDNDEQYTVCVCAFYINDWNEELVHQLSFIGKQFNACYRRFATARKSHIGDELIPSSSILSLCATLHDQDAVSLQRKVLMFLLQQTHCEAGCFLLVDRDRQEFFCQVITNAILDKEIRFPIHSSGVMSILRNVESATLEMLALEHLDVLRQHLGKPVVTSTCIPVTSNGLETGDVIAIVCLINKHSVISGDKFTEHDEAIVRHCFKYTTNVLHSAIAVQKECKLKMQTEGLLQVTKNLFSHLENLPRLLKEVMLEAKKLTNAQCCSVFLYNERLKQLVAKVFDGDVTSENDEGLSDVRFPICLGIAGYVATTNQMLNVDDAYSHPLFYIGIDEMTGFKTRNILCFPLKNSKGEVIGVAELCNKIGGGPFTRFDEEIAEAFSVYCSISVLHSLLYDGAQKAALRFRLANEMMVYHMKVTDEDVHQLAGAVVPTPNKFLADMNVFSCIPRDIRTEDTPLAIVSMFHDLGFVTRHQIFPDRLARFVLMVKKGYRDPPYHNWSHAFAVTHFCYLLLKNIKCEKFISNIEAFALFLSCLGHDIDHRGTTNSYQKVSGSALADLYSSEGSMLERHHYAQTQSIINTAGCDILMNLSTEDYATALDIIQELILGTDLAEHMKVIDKMDRMADEGYDVTNTEHRHLLLRLMMTACDLSDQTKNFKNSRTIAECIYSEFFSQGDLEKRMGKKPMELMDRDKAVIPTLQINFLDSIALPVYRILTKLLPETSVVLDAVENNRHMWFQANERLLERNLPRNMDVFRHLDGLGL